MAVEALSDINRSGTSAFDPGAGASLPVDVVAPAAGQEAAVVVDGVWKRAPIASLIHDAYPAPLGLWDYWYLWRIASGNATASDSFNGAAISSGTNTTALPTGGMAGFNSHGVFLRSSTTANGGYRYQTTSLVGDYFGTISHKFRAQFLWRTSFTGRTLRIGYHDTSTSADAVDGAYFEVLDAVCSAKTSNNSTRTTHATTLTLSLDVAYTFDIEVNSTGTEARFRVYGGQDQGTALLDVTITTNIPTTSARSFGAGIVATEVSTTASDIGILYSLGMGTVAGFDRAQGVYASPAVGPVPFAAGDWTATAVAGGVELNITAMPAAGSSAVTAINYRINGGAAVALAGTGTGVRTVTGLTPGEAVSMQIQQVTAVGGSQWSDTKTRTPGATSGATLVQQTSVIDFRGSGADGNYVAALPFDSPSTAGTTLVVQCNIGYWNTATIADSAGGSVAGGEWTLEISEDPLGSTADRTQAWVRRNAPAGITGVTVTSTGNFFQRRLYMAEVAGLSNVAAIVDRSLVGSAGQNAAAVSVPGAGFLSALVRTDPSRTPVSASAGTTVRRYDAGGYSATVSEHWIHGISTGARDFNSSWPDGASTIGYHGIFIPAA